MAFEGDDTILPFQLTHSWPLFEQHERFDHGRLFQPRVRLATEMQLPRGIGTWECDLKTESLNWSEDVFDLFGLPRGAAVTRAETVALYAESSRAAMERLRAYSIKHRRGFTLDAEILPVKGSSRWMRLIAMPVCVDNRVVRLRGIKQGLR